MELSRFSGSAGGAWAFAHRLARLAWMAPLLLGHAGAQIVIGQSASLSGGTAVHSRAVVLGARACFEAANRRGGVHGESLRLVTLDDHGDRREAETNTRRLLQDDHALLLFGYTTRPTAEAGLEVAEDEKAVFFAPASGGETLRGPGHAYAFHVRPGYASEYRKIVDTPVTTGVHSFAVVVNTDDRSGSNRRAAEAALRHHGLRLAAEVAVDRNRIAIDAAVPVLLAADAQVLIVAASGKSIAPLLEALRDRGYHGQFATISFVGATLPDELGRYAPGLIVTNVMPLPSHAADPLVRAAGRDLALVEPSARPTFSSLEGYAAACSLVAVLNRIEPLLRGAALESAIESLGEIPVPPIGMLLRFTAHRHTANTFIDIAIVGRSGRLVD
jgi:ABC-type branched-subunit amino acid transport system substrate-binding protein